MRGLQECGRGCGLLALLMLGAAQAGAAPLQRAVMLRVPPDYPEIAVRMHVEGEVEVEVTAMPDGSATRVHAISGHSLLTAAAERCVMRWRFLQTKTAQRGTVVVVFSRTE